MTDLNQLAAASNDKAVKRGVGRPSTYSSEIAQKIGTIMSVYPDYANCLRGLGIKVSTGRSWLDQGRRGVEPYIELARIVDTAKAKVITTLVGELRTGEDASKRWLLQKLAPTKFCDRYRLEHTGANGAPIQVDTGANLLELIAKRRTNDHDAAVANEEALAALPGPKP